MDLNIFDVHSFTAIFTLTETHLVLSLARGSFLNMAPEPYLTSLLVLDSFPVIKSIL